MKFTRLLILISSVLLIAGCSSDGWLIDDPRVHNVTFYLESTPDERFELDEKRLNEMLITELRASVSDSLAQNAFERVQSAYGGTGKTDFLLVDTLAEADLVFRIEEVSIRGVRTLNVVHPGPVFRIRARITGWRGERKVFDKTNTMHNNLALVASEGSRFYIPSTEEREDLGLQQKTIYPVLRSVYGQIWQDVADQNRKMR